MSLKNKKFSLSSSIAVEGGGFFGLRKGGLKSGNKKFTRSQSLHETQLESPLNPSLSSNMSLSVLREQATAEENLERSDELVSNHDFIKHNKSFHKLFPEIPEGESVAHAFTCSLQKEVLYHGKLFVSESHVCFHSSVLLKDTKVVIPVSSIKDVKKHNSALSVLSIKTAEEKYSFVSLRSRELCYKLLQSVRAHAQAEGANSGPHFSSAENEADHDLLSSYSSLEDRVDLNLSSDSLDTSFLHMSSEGPSRSNSTRQNSFTDDDNRAGPWIWRAIERLTEIKNLSVLFHIYVMLMVLILLASGYIGLRILALQEQLNSLGALTDWSSHHRE
ncbi:GRAM domain-containing protein 2B-like [Archocentrus centrarchus]|uniref:GRAM domain-containing protein 2B-like n=1 Tax=Archocentrus centrarchus TaxID=63155 RepID=UPI0011E9BBAA|nr:GRAM domain-containing protein 2B-like [Archocentrus centrarchus]